MNESGWLDSSVESWHQVLEGTAKLICGRAGRAGRAGRGFYKARDRLSSRYGSRRLKLAARTTISAQTLKRE
jgi:hypothetical protein